MCTKQIIVELSSDEDTPVKKRSRRTAEMICLDDDPETPSSSKKIAITIEDPRHHRTLTVQEKARPSTKNSTTITIQFQDSDTENDRAPNISKVTREEPIIKKRVNLISQPSHKPNCQGQYSPLYTELIELCLLLDASDDMRQVVEKKMKHYYKRADEAFVRSPQFQQLIADCIQRLSTDSAHMWVHIKDVVDALRLRRISEKSAVHSEDPSDPTVQKKIAHLEHKMRTLQELVQRLDEQEVDFDQEDQSVYLRADKYKARLVEVHAQLCRLRGVRAASYSRVRIERRYGRAGGPATKLEQWVNEPVASGRPPQFPDFHDVLECVREASRQDHLLWSDVQIANEARELFTACGRALQRKRQRREWRLAAARLADGGARDPADSSAELQAVLANNSVIARRRVQEVLDEYENKQMMLKTGVIDTKTNLESKSAELTLESSEKADRCEIIERFNVSKCDEKKNATQESEYIIDDHQAVDDCTQKETVRKSLIIEHPVQEGECMEAFECGSDDECCILSSDDGDKEKENDDSSSEATSDDDSAYSVKSSKHNSRDGVLVLSDSEGGRSLSLEQDELQLLRRMEYRSWEDGVPYTTCISMSSPRSPTSSLSSHSSNSSECVVICYDKASSIDHSLDRHSPR